MQWFDFGAARLAYIDERPIEPTDAPPILLIHGFASTHAVNWVFPLWVKTLVGDGRRVIALDNRGHGRSEKFYDPAAYRSEFFALDCCDLLDHLGIAQADVMGYSMGARIGAFLARLYPQRLRKLILGGLGYHLVDRVGLPMGIAEAMETDQPDLLVDPQQKMFRAFAGATKSDLKALAACIRGSRQAMSPGEIGEIAAPTLICVGTKDEVAGDPHALAKLFARGRAVDIPGCDHNRAVGDKTFKAAVLTFLKEASA